MRTADLRALEAQYPATTNSDSAFAEALGLSMPATRSLVEELWADLDDRHGILGIGWWFPHPGTRKRILISDYLLMATTSVEDNLLEARLHHLEALDSWDQEDLLLSRAVDYDDQGRVVVKFPRRARGLDDLPRKLRDLHIVGLFRAIGSALDCLAASIIGTLAMPLPIQRADLGGLRRWMDQQVWPDGTSEATMWLPVREALADQPHSAHEGWLKWTLDYRNTLVHRARPVQLSNLEPKPTLERADRQVPFIRTREILHLPRDPQRSDIEMLHAFDSPVLNEDAKITVQCVFEEAVALCENVAALLVDGWTRRRAEPALLPQPQRQWPDDRGSLGPVFDGCRPGSDPFSPAMLVSAGPVLRRMKAASLLNEDKVNWQTFD